MKHKTEQEPASSRASSGRPVGDPHYRAYVGPEDQYDFMGATQFRLLCTLGLRAHHHVLDIGCGSLRAGRLLIPYLQPGGYFGIEPNAYLIEAAFDQELGADIRRIKQPTFAHVADFSIPFDGPFDIIVAQSIYSHTGLPLLRRSVAAIADKLAPDGMALVTIVEGPGRAQAAQWHYPDNVTTRPGDLRAAARAAGLRAHRLPWFHPRQAWYLLSHPGAPVPGWWGRRYLKGAVLMDPDFRASRNPPRRWAQAAGRWVRLRLPATIKRFAKRLIGR